MLTAVSRLEELGLSHCQLIIMQVGALALAWRVIRRQESEGIGGEDV